MHVAERRGSELYTLLLWTDWAERGSHRRRVELILGMGRGDRTFSLPITLLFAARIIVLREEKGPRRGSPRARGRASHPCPQFRDLAAVTDWS